MKHFESSRHTLPKVELVREGHVRYARGGASNPSNAHIFFFKFYFLNRFRALYKYTNAKARKRYDVTTHTPARSLESGDQVI